MHEMSTVVRMANLAIRTAEEHHAKKVLSITVEIGEMTDILPYYVEKYYPIAAKGTILEGSSITVKTAPAKAQCTSCGTVYHPDREHNYACPKCGGLGAKILAGRHTELRRVVMEDDDEKEGKTHGSDC